MSYELNKKHAIDSVCAAFFGKGLQLSNSDKVKTERLIEEFELTVGDIHHEQS